MNFGGNVTYVKLWGFFFDSIFLWFIFPTCSKFPAVVSVVIVNLESFCKNCQPTAWRCQAEHQERGVSVAKTEGHFHFPALKINT